jgi:hypothetical protein
MTYSILAVRTSGYTDGRLFPVAEDGLEPIALESLDGAVDRLTGCALHVSELVAGSLKTAARFKDLEADVLVTDARVAVACDEYSKGRGWVGFGGGECALVAASASGVSKARAVHGRRGLVLVGHVRYPWLRCAGFKPKTGWTSTEEIRLGVAASTRGGEPRALFLDIALPKTIESSDVARVIASRAAQYMLSHELVDDAAERTRTEYEALRAPRRLADPAAGTFASYQMPGYVVVNPLSAYPVAKAPSVEGKR